MNEIQIIRQQLGTEQRHFAEVAQACVTALDSGKFVAGSHFVAACADYLAFALTRLVSDSRAPSLQAPAANATPERWREFLPAFIARVHQHFAALEALATRNPLVTEWRAASRIDADSMFSERAHYERFKAAVT